MDTYKVEMACYATKLVQAQSVQHAEELVSALPLSELDHTTREVIDCAVHNPQSEGDNTR